MIQDSLHEPAGETDIHLYLLKDLYLALQKKKLSREFSKIQQKEIIHVHMQSKDNKEQ